MSEKGGPGGQLWITALASSLKGNERDLPTLA